MLDMAAARNRRPAPAGRPVTHRRRWTKYVTVLLIVATVGQLAVATFVTGLPQFEGKAFGSRLVAYPILMTLPVLTWWVVARYRRASSALLWAAFACICAPFFIDVTGNTLDLYDSVVWWDDAVRHGTELDTAYTDTLGDEALGTLGAAVAGLLLVKQRRR